MTKLRLIQGGGETTVPVFSPIRDRLYKARNYIWYGKNKVTLPMFFSLSETSVTNLFNELAKSMYGEDYNAQ